MGDRAPVHIMIGGSLPQDHLEEFAMRAADYDLRIEWDGDPFDPAILPEGEPLELYGMELNGGLVDDLDAFCIEHGLTFRRWSGGCLGAFLPEIVIHDGTGKVRVYTETIPEFHRITAFNGLGTSVAKHKKKGDLVEVQGRLHYSKWTDKDRQERYSVEIVAEEVLFL
jgi:Single-strand binding protein family